MIATLVGAGHLAAWLAGGLSRSGLTAITMKTNAALCLTLVGTALLLLEPVQAASARRWSARVLATVALIVGLLTLVENLAGWDFGIDELLAVETAGAMGVASPNRMGLPASLGFTFAGMSLLIFSRRDHRGVKVAQSLALAICLVSLLAVIGFLYGARELYGIARYTGIAWPTAVSLLLLGMGLLCLRPTEGLMVQVTADDPGGISLRRLLPAALVLPLLLGWLRLAGERIGLFDTAMGTGMVMVSFIVIFSALAYRVSHQASSSARALRQSGERLRAIFDNAGVGLVEVAHDDCIVVANDRLCEILGYERRELLGRKIHDLTAPEDRATSDTLNARLHEGLVDRIDYEKRYLHRDGSPIWVHVTISSVHDAQGRWLRSIGTVEDIAERKRAEEALRRSEARWNAAIEHFGEGAIIATEAEQVVYWNPAARSLHGFTSETEGIGPLRETPNMFQLWTPDGSRLLALDEWPMRRIKRGETVRNLELSLRRPDQGWEKIVSYSGAMVETAGGERLIFLSVFDLTEQRRAEAALRQLNATLESKVVQRTAELQRRARQLQKLTLELTQAEERERRRIAVILHEDLQQQITGAKFQLSVIRTRMSDAALAARIDRVDAMLTGAVEKSRNLSHDLSPAVVRMNDLAEVLHWLAGRLRDQHGLKVDVEASGDMILRSESLALFLFRAVQEMLFNVVKHARVREAAVRARRIGSCVSLCVSDGGRGFDLEELKGTSGVGLFSIRERTELLGGRMKIRSDKGRGSRLRITVPDRLAAKGRDMKTQTGQVDAPYARSSAAVLSAPDGALRVLLVDDHDIVREGLAALLEESPDIQVVGEAADGREAIDMTSDLRPDVVIMDVSMPLMSGDQATRLIKTHMPETRVIALSMFDEAEKKERMYRAGAESYVLKTATPDELLAAIRGPDRSA